jgi:hypothetical protein
VFPRGALDFFLLVVPLTLTLPLTLLLTLTHLVCGSPSRSVRG